MAGAVYAPALAELFVACEGQPAQLNGDELNVSPVSSLAESLVMTGLDRLTSHGLERRELFGRIADKAQRTRVVGSAALDMCQVAAGRAEAYFEAGVYWWDVAAAGLIVRQAGGQAETLARLDAPHRQAFLASNGRVHDELKSLLQFGDL